MNNEEVEFPENFHMINPRTIAVIRRRVKILTKRSQIIKDNPGIAYEKLNLPKLIGETTDTFGMMNLPKCPPPPPIRIIREDYTFANFKMSCKKIKKFFANLIKK